MISQFLGIALRVLGDLGLRRLQALWLWLQGLGLRSWGFLPVEKNFKAANQRKWEFWRLVRVLSELLVLTV